jgi:hypothetical protein
MVMLAAPEAGSRSNAEDATRRRAYRAGVLFVRETSLQPFIEVVGEFQNLDFYFASAAVSVASSAVGVPICLRQR